MFRAEGAEFSAFVKAGRKLGDLHCGYEKVKPWPDCVVDVKPVQGTFNAQLTTFNLTRMRFAKKEHSMDENRNGKLEHWAPR